MEDLTVVPDRLPHLNQAQVFEAMEKMTSSSESEPERLNGGSDDSVLRVSFLRFGYILYPTPII